MWTWEHERRRAQRELEVQLGQVTLSGEPAAVNMGGERRWLNVCAPGALQWRPREGQQVLVVKAEGEEPYILGTVGEGDLLPGQTRLTGGNCAIFLGHRLELQGDVYINGEKLEDYVKRAAGPPLGG